MRHLPNTQRGASAIVTIVVLAILAYAVYLGIQYVPLAIESRSVDSIMSTMRNDQRTDPVTTEQAAKAKLARLLNVNEMNDMAKSMKVSRGAGTIIIKVSYDRELNLGYKIQPMHYEKVLELKK